MKVLLVEDHEELSDVLSRRLKRAGFEVLIAGDGPQGIQMATAALPDIVLLDLNLPIMDGWSVAAQLKADLKTSDIPIIALTAQSIGKEGQPSLSSAFDDYHPKPLDFPRLLEQIEQNLLDRERQRS